MKRINLYYFLLVAICFSCEKQTPEPPPALSEYIIGDWEAREYMDFLNYRDFEYHSVGPPYIVFYRFKEDGTFEIWLKGNPGIPFPFLVNEQDSILTLGSGEMKLYSFSETVIDMRYNGEHGLTGHRLYKID